MHEGKVPYRDLFDHKGPVLYFVEYLGAFGGTIGIWALPGICYSFYIFTKYLKTGKYQKMEIFFIGVTFMNVLLLRANMVSVWIAYLPVIIIVMITRRQLSSLI